MGCLRERVECNLNPGHVLRLHAPLARAGRGDAGRDAVGLQGGTSRKQRLQGGQAVAVVATVGDQLAG